jgi:hypothetical protein
LISGLELSYVFDYHRERIITFRIHDNKNQRGIIVSEQIYNLIKEFNSETFKSLTRIIYEGLIIERYSAFCVLRSTAGAFI